MPTKPECDLWTFLRRELTPYKVGHTRFHLHHFIYRPDGGKFMMFDKHFLVTGTPDNWRLEVMEEQDKRLETIDTFFKLTDSDLVDKLKEMALEFATLETQREYVKQLMMR